VILHKETAAAGRQSFHEFILGIPDPFDRLKGIQMLRSDAGDCTVCRVYQTAEFTDIPHMACAHFRDKHLM
jgi:hypothetical protein